MKVRFRAAAMEELRDAIDYHAQIQPELGDRLARAVAEALADILEYPKSAPVVDRGCRRRKVSDFPYGIVYRIKNGWIEVFAVMHLHRRPGYWRDRLRPEGDSA